MSDTPRRREDYSLPDELRTPGRTEGEGTDLVMENGPAVADRVSGQKYTHAQYYPYDNEPDRRVVVTLYTLEILHLPATLEITSLPQLTPEGLPLALARRAAEEARMARAVAELEARGEAVTSRALTTAAHISMNTAGTWLRQRETGVLESEAMLSTLHYNSHSISDNIPAANQSAESVIPEDVAAAVDPPIVAPTPSNIEPLMPALPVACLAASHRLLWRWSAGAWQCPTCGG